MATMKLPLINRSITNPVWYNPNQLSSANNLSEHQACYIKHRLSNGPLSYSAENSRNRPYELSQISFDSNSESRAQYARQIYHNPQLLRRRDQIQISKTPMESLSSYTDQFGVKDRIQANAMRPKMSQLNYLFSQESPENELSSLYRSDYQKANDQTRLDSKFGNRKFVKFSDKTSEIDGTATSDQNDSMYNSDYRKHFQNVVPTRVYLPTPVYKTPKEPLICETSYSKTYINHPYSKSQMLAPKESNIEFGSYKDNVDTTYTSDFIRRHRDDSLDRLKIHQNMSSFVHTVPHDRWLNESNSQPFNDYSNHFFIKNKHIE